MFLQLQSWPQPPPHCPLPAKCPLIRPATRFSPRLIQLTLSPSPVCSEVCKAHLPRSHQASHSRIPETCTPASTHLDLQLPLFTFLCTSLAPHHISPTLARCLWCLLLAESCASLGTPGRADSCPHPHPPTSPSGSVSLHQTSQPEEPIPLFNPLDNPHLHFHDGSAVKNLPAMQETFNPWVGEIPWRRE